jgi:hypothetical protein
MSLVIKDRNKYITSVPNSQILPVLRMALWKKRGWGFGALDNFFEALSLSPAASNLLQVLRSVFLLSFSKAYCLPIALITLRTKTQ